MGLAAASFALRMLGVERACSKNAGLQETNPKGWCAGAHLSAVSWVRFWARRPQPVSPSWSRWHQRPVQADAAPAGQAPKPKSKGGLEPACMGRGEDARGSPCTSSPAWGLPAAAEPREGRRARGCACVCEPLSSYMKPRGFLFPF